MKQLRTRLGEGSVRNVLVVATMVMLSLSVARLWIGGKLLYYIHPSTSWWVGLGGAVLGIMVIFWLRARVDHVHIPGKQLLGVLLVASVVTFSPNVPLSAALAPKREGGLGAPVGSRAGIRPGAVTKEFTILEWLAAWDSDPTYQRYIGSEVNVTGFLTEDGGRVFVNRYMVTCCAVDAQLLRIQVTGLQEVPESDQWVALSGVMQRDGELPVITATGFTRVGTPAKPYLY